MLCTRQGCVKRFFEIPDAGLPTSNTSFSSNAGRINLFCAFRQSCVSRSCFFRSQTEQI